MTYTEFIETLAKLTTESGDAWTIKRGNLNSYDAPPVLIRCGGYCPITYVCAKTGRGVYHSLLYDFAAQRMGLDENTARLIVEVADSNKECVTRTELLKACGLAGGDVA